MKVKIRELWSVKVYSNVQKLKLRMASVVILNISENKVDF